MPLHALQPIRRILAIAVPFAILSLPAVASAASPPPTPHPAPSGFSARGHADVKVQTQSRSITGNIQMAVEQRGNVARVDVLSVTNDFMPLPPIAFSVVVDRNVNTMTIWNDATKRYFTQKFTVQPGTRDLRVAGAGTKSPFAALDIFSFAMNLTGHTTTNGVATTGLSMDALVAKKGETATTHVTAMTQLVDDAPFFPMTFSMNVEQASKNAKLEFVYAVDRFSRTLPAQSTFRVPLGYAKAKNILDAVAPGGGAHVVPTMTMRPAPMMSPAPSMSTMPSPKPMSSGMPMTSPMPMGSGMPIPMSSGMPMTSPSPHTR